MTIVLYRIRSSVVRIVLRMWDNVAFTVCAVTGSVTRRRVRMSRWYNKAAVDRPIVVTTQDTLIANCMPGRYFIHSEDTANFPDSCYYWTMCSFGSRGESVVMWRGKHVACAKEKAESMHQSRSVGRTVHVAVHKSSDSIKKNLKI